MLILRDHQRGFTLIELMIGVIIMGILFAAAAPSFSGWIQNAQVRTAAESISGGLQLARAEAVRRNSTIRFNLIDASGAGLVDWEICATNTTPCAVATDIIQSRSSAEGTANARIGVNDDTDAPGTVANYAAVIAAGNELPAHVTFNGLGRVVKLAGADDVLERIDVTNATLANARRLVITISNPGGQIRMCDPALSNTDAQGC